MLTCSVTRPILYMIELRNAQNKCVLLIINAVILVQFGKYFVAVCACIHIAVYENRNTAVYTA